MTSETVQAAQRLLADLLDATQSAFITSESCGATAEYRHIFKFRTLAELQAFGRAWAAVVSLQPAPAAAPEDAEHSEWLPLNHLPERECPVEYLTKSGEILQGSCLRIYRKDGLQMTHLYQGWVVYWSAERLGITAWRPAGGQGVEG